MYMGRWYEFARSKNIPFERGTCITADYSLPDPDKGKVDVTNTQYISETQTLDSVQGEAYCSKFESGQCGVKFNFFQPYGNYHIVDTDYTSYSIVYSCSNFVAGALCVEFLWILSRDTYVQGSVEELAF